MKTSRTDRHRIRQFERFEREFKKMDLGFLEPVREYVAMHAWDNAGDVPVLTMARVALATAFCYVDDEETGREVFSVYDESLKTR